MDTFRHDGIRAGRVLWLRHDGLYFKRLFWWFPSHLAEPDRTRVFTGADEWCNESVVLVVPPLGAFVVFWRRHWRVMPSPHRLRASPGSGSRG